MRLTRLLTDKEIKLANDYSTREETKREKGDYTILENVKPFDAINKLGQLEDILEKYKIDTNEELEILCKYAKDVRYWMSIYKEKMFEIRRIEDELGIDLITLFKALKQGGVYVKNGITEDTAIKMHSFQICGDNNGITIWSQIKLNAEDYGKTWALTKEELL